MGECWEAQVGIEESGSWGSVWNLREFKGTERGHDEGLKS